MTIKILSILMVMIGAVVLFLSFSPAIKICRNLIGGVRRKWVIILYLMGFFILGYLSFDIILISNLSFPLELVTGSVFLGGAVFVFIVMNISLSTVTALQKSDEAIRVAKDDWESTFDAVTDMVTIHDMDFNIIRANPAARAAFGQQQHEGLSSKKCFNCYHGTEKPPSGCVSCLSLQTGKPSSTEVFEPHLNKHLEIRAMPRFGNDGRLAGLIHVVRDITERKQAEQKLRESEIKFRSMIEAITDPTYICSHDFRIEYMNPAMIEKVGRDATGEICHKVLYDEDEKCSWCLFDQIQQGKHITYEKIDPKTGRFYSINCSPFFGSDAQASLIAIFRDITEIKKLEKERLATEAKFQQAMKMESIGTLAGGIAHDFNNILSAIIGYTELALMKNETGVDTQSCLTGVLTAGNRAKDLVKQILAFSRHAETEKKPVQIGLVAKEALKLLRATLPSTIEIRENILSKSLILCDPTQIHQIVMNICTNAAHAMRNNSGILEVKLSDIELDSILASTYPGIQPGPYIKLTINDNGLGMTPEVKNRIFDPFFTTKEKGEGTGLGLSVVHGIVGDCGGAIDVYSKPGHGTTFTLYFPTIQRKMGDKPVEYSILPTGTEHILCVDDEKPIGDILMKMLSTLGYTVEIRASSLEALEFFKAVPSKFDLVITDMTMPQMTGDMLARELMKIRPDLPVILCTGFSENMTKEMAETMGIKAFLMKPLLKVEIAHTIRKVLDEAKGTTL